MYDHAYAQYNDHNIWQFDNIMYTQVSCFHLTCQQCLGSTGQHVVNLAPHALKLAFPSEYIKECHEIPRWIQNCLVKITLHN